MNYLNRTTLDETPTEEDLRVIGRQLGREPRGVVTISHRCPCGCPTVVRTEPRLPDGTPFPTSFYATCPRLTAAISTLESSGLMKDLSQRLAQDESLAWSYSQAHDDYLRRREELAHVPEIAGISAGGMPNRVKCLHVLVAHALAAGPGVNPLGDEALEALPEWWHDGCCGALEPRDDTDGEAPQVVANTCPRHHPIDPLPEDGGGAVAGGRAQDGPDGMGQLQEQDGEDRA